MNCSTNAMKIYSTFATRQTGLSLCSKDSKKLISSCANESKMPRMLSKMQKMKPRRQISSKASAKTTLTTKYTCSSTTKHLSKGNQKKWATRPIRPSATCKRTKPQLSFAAITTPSPSCSHRTTKKKKSWWNTLNLSVKLQPTGHMRKCWMQPGLAAAPTMSSIRRHSN